MTAESDSAAPGGMYGIILAAGFSSRMGDDHKALLQLGSGSMLTLCVRALQDGGVKTTIVVAGYRHAEVAAAALALGAEPVYNPGYAQGMFSSVCAGFERIMALDRADGQAVPAAVFLLPVDAPLVQAWTIRLLASRWRDIAKNNPDVAKKTILIPAFSGRNGHPPLIGLDHLENILDHRAALSRDGGLRTYFSDLMDPEQHTALGRSVSAAPVPAGGEPQVTFIPIPDAGVCSDLDRTEDHAKARRFLVLTRNRTLPSPEEALAWLKIAGIGKSKIRHSILVAAGSVLLAEALGKTGKKVDLPLTAAGGLLHDIVRKCRIADKKCKAHARRAMDMLSDRGWPECAQVVGAHTVLPDSLLADLEIAMTDMPVICRMQPKCAGGMRDETYCSAPDSMRDPYYTGIAEKTLMACTAVYLADKFFFMDRFVSLDERFEQVRERFNGDEATTVAILHRKKVAEAVSTWFSKQTGRNAREILAHVRNGVCNGVNNLRREGKASPEALWREALARCCIEIWEKAGQ